MYEQKNFDNLIGTQGFSETLLKNHFTLYGGYVTNVNKLITDLAVAEKDGWMGTPGYSELKRRFGWEWNGMRLHELYFGNMTSSQDLKQPEGELAEKINTQFGSYDKWLADFKATGAMRGIGWSILYHDPVNDKLFNTWVNEHDMGHLAGCNPLLIIDVFEHAYVTDYGIKRADYIDAFINAINWAEVNNRL